MNPAFDIFTRGWDFIRNNPQILYTLFLLLAIPLAFFFTSQQFLQIAQDNQDRLERSRVALLSDVFVEFTKEHINDPEYLEGHIVGVAAQNQPISRFVILVASGTDLLIHASMDASERGGSFVFLPETEKTKDLFRFAETYPESPMTEPYYSKGERIIRTVRLIPTGDEREAFMLVDFSMAQADAVALRNIRNAYIVLVFILLLIIGLLARQARIIDYAALYKRLKEVDRMKDDFVSMAAHELRSPLTVIRGYVDLISGNEEVEEKHRKVLKQIDVSAQQLNTLIGDILDVAKLQEGRMSFNAQPTDVSEALLSIVDSFKKPALDKGLALSYEPSNVPKISVDPDRFRQIMINLVGNAVKYTPKGEVRVIATAKDGQVELRVSDTGMGISAEDQQKLFGKFFRVKNEETKHIVGTGLGLWITATLVKQMKGTISVESIRGKGTDFIVNFPTAQ